MSEKFNPHDSQFKKVDDLPEKHRKDYIDLPDGGFTSINAVRDSEVAKEMAKAEDPYRESARKEIEMGEKAALEIFNKPKLEKVLESDEELQEEANAFNNDRRKKMLSEIKFYKFSDTEIQNKMTKLIENGAGPDNPELLAGLKYVVASNIANADSLRTHFKKLLTSYGYKDIAHMKAYDPDKNGGHAMEYFREHMEPDEYWLKLINKSLPELKRTFDFKAKEEMLRQYSSETEEYDFHDFGMGHGMLLHNIAKRLGYENITIYTADEGHGREGMTYLLGQGLIQKNDLVKFNTSYTQERPRRFMVSCTDGTEIICGSKNENYINDLWLIAEKLEGKTILLVEDKLTPMSKNVTTSDVLTKMEETFDCKIVYANNFVEALYFLTTQKFDKIVTDGHYPFLPDNFKTNLRKDNSKELIIEKGENVEFDGLMDTPGFREEAIRLLNLVNVDAEKIVNSAVSEIQK